MYQGASHSIIAPPWCISNFNSLSTIGIGNNSSTINSVDLGASFNLEYNMGSHIAEDFLIEDLSEFSSEDIAAPINVLGSNYASLRHSDDNTSSKDLSSIVKSCDTITSSCDSVLLQDSAALDRSCAQQAASCMKDSCLNLSCRDDIAGFDWLTSFGEDNLIYGASNFGMDSFLLNTADPFGGYDGIMKQGSSDNGNVLGIIDGDDSNVKDMKLRQCSGGSENDGGGDNGNGSSDAMMTPHVILHVPGRARSKRSRSAGWSSSSILCSWSSNSPTNSLDSTSNLFHVPKPHSFPPCKEEEDYNHLNQPHNYHTNVQLNSPSSKELSDDHNIELSRISKFDSDKQALNGRINEENHREESVSMNDGLQPRRCTHCLSQKTPQWRAGPHGPKTLCNACGVRFKSGRLFEEYRPAKSPTFLSYRHSNSHKKVVEMRRRKGIDLYYTNHRVKHTDDQLIKLRVKLNPSPESQPHFAAASTLINNQTIRAALESTSFLY